MSEKRMLASPDRITIIADLLPPEYSETWREMSAALNFPPQLFNLKADLNELISLRTDINRIPKTWYFFDQWFNVIDYLLTHERELSPRLGLPGGRYPTTHRAGQYGNRYYGHTSKYQLLACLNQTFHDDARKASVQFKIALIIFAHQNYRDPVLNPQISKFAIETRKAARTKAPGNQVFVHLSKNQDRPERWYSAAVAKLNLILESDKQNVEQQNVSRQFLNLLESILKNCPIPTKLVEVKADLPYIDMDDNEPDSTSDIKRPLQIRIPIPPTPTDDIDVVASEPELATFDIADDIPHGAMLPIRAVEQQQQRYTNFRTALGNQRLPFAWNQLNSFDIQVLVATLKSDLISHDNVIKSQALLVFLILTTGKHFQSMLEMPIEQQQSEDYLQIEGYWIRYIRPPPNPFKPSKEQLHYLSNHTSFICHALPPIIVSSLRTLLIHPGGTVADSLGVDIASGEQLIRNYLKNLRTTHNVRLTVGRLQNALANTMMQICGDKTLVHHLTSIKSDMPPAGVYYTSYNSAHAIKIYQKTVQRLFGYD